MMSIYNIKPKFQRLLIPALTLLHKFGVTANQITLSSIFLSFLIGLAFWNADDHNILFLALPIGLLIRMALNALDGMMARIYNQQTNKGEILNEIGDIISDLFIFFPLLLFEKDNLYLVVIFICLSIINEFAGILAKVISGKRRYDGPMGKSDRAFVMGTYGIFNFLAINFRTYSLWFFCLLILMIIISTILRLRNSMN